MIPFKSKELVEHRLYSFIWLVVVQNRRRLFQCCLLSDCCRDSVKTNLTCF